MRRFLVVITFITACLGNYAQTDTLRQYHILFNEAMLQRQKGNNDAAFDLLDRCRELKNDAPEVYFFLAQYYTKIKNNDKALDYFKKAASLSPENITFMETLAHAYAAKEMYEEAAEVVEKMYQQDKSRQELLEMLYGLYIEQEKFTKAIDVLERMEIIDGKSERISLAKSALYMQMNDRQKAVAAMKELSDEHPYDMNYRTLYANTLISNGDLEEAHDILTKILQEEPGHVKAQQSLRTYYNMMSDSEASDSISRAILLNRRAEINDKIILLRQLISENEAHGGDSTQILKLFNEMMQLPQPDADIAEMKAAYMDLKKMPKDSVASALEKVLELAPDRASARLQLVQFAWENNNDQRIIELCKMARQYNPEEMAFYYFQGLAYYRIDEKDNALEAFRNGINVIDNQSSPDIVSDFYSMMGDLLYIKGREKEAFAAYDSCLQWKPDNIGCLNNYAYYLSTKGKNLQKAEQMSYKTIKAEPKNATYLDTYAWILFMQERYAEAKIYIDQALQNDSTPGAVITEHAGDIYALTGDIQGAIDLWKKAYKEDKENKLLARKIKRKKYIKQ